MGQFIVWAAAVIVLAGNSPDDGFDRLKRRLLEGHFEEVSAALNTRDPNGGYTCAGYRFAGLRAACARGIFFLYARQASPLDWPSEEEGKELRRLACLATAAYEEAFRLAPSDFERACVYARWHELHTRHRFEADSLLLRRGSPLERVNEPVSAALAQQVSRLRAAAALVLDPLAPLGQPMSQETKDLFLDVFAEEYRKLGRMGVPEDLFAELLRDVPIFLQKAIHPAVLADPVKYRIMIQYHLWYALTGPRPDRIDREFIEQQIKAVEECLREGFARGLLPGYEQAMLEAFRELVALERGNRFIPRFKQPLWPFEWSQEPDIYQKSIEGRIRETIENAARTPGQMLPRSFPAAEAQKAMQEHAATSIRSLMAGLMSHLGTYQGFYYQQPPGVTLLGGGGTTHDASNVWVYTVDKSEPVPPYPWKKAITPIDSSTASTRQIALRVLKALGEDDVATLDTLILESKVFSKQDVRKLAQVLAEGGFAAQPQSLEDANDILIEKAWSWSAVRIRPPGREEGKAPVLVFRWKDGIYWLAWAGAVEKGLQQPLAGLLAQLKPGLELPVPPAPVKIVPPTAVTLVDDFARMESLEPLDAGHGWRVQLALAELDYLSPLKLLCCRAQWIDANRPPKTIPFGRYAAPHLGPVLWTVRADGFREKALERSSHPTPPMSLQGDGCLYAAVLPLQGVKEAYVQVYCAFDGRELARQRIRPAEASTWPWGCFAAHKTGELFGVSADFQTAVPGIPAFRAVPWSSGEAAQGKGTSIALSLQAGFFDVKAEKRILPARGSRLLARWWLNEEPVLPQAAGEVTPLAGVYAEGQAGLFRLPASLPRAALKAKRGDKIGLQLMLCPGGIESPSIPDTDLPNGVGPEIDEAPAVPVLTNRIDFEVDAALLAPRRPPAPTAASFQALNDAIQRQDVAEARRLVAACPQLATADARSVQGSAVPGSSGVTGGVVGGGSRGSGQSALDLLCRARPQPRYFLRWKIGGEVDSAYWKLMAEIAGIFIDHGADVNARAQMGETPLQALIGSQFEFGRSKEEAPALDLLAVLLERGADANVGNPRNSRGTILWQVVHGIQTYKCPAMIPIAEILLRYGADVFAVEEPWQHQPVFEQLDSLKGEGQAELAALIARYGQDRRTALEQAVRRGVAELLADLRNADEKTLSALNDELPWAQGLDWIRLGRMLQEEFGPALDGLGRIDQISLRGAWAGALLPTGRQGDRANLCIILARYSGGAYHAVRATFADTGDAGMHLRNAQMTYRDLMNAVYSALGRSESMERSGEGSTEYPRHFGLLSIASERGRLVARPRDSAGWLYSCVELTADEVWLWRRGWDLGLRRRMTFATGARQLIMANGVITVRDGDRTIVFRRYEDQVRLEQDRQERLSPAFLLDLQTFEVK
jgi:hypothetical protein